MVNYAQIDEAGAGMRSVRIVIIRLLVDAKAPETLRGTLQVIPEDEARAFAGEDALLALLRQIKGRIPAPGKPESSRRNAS